MIDDVARQNAAARNLLFASSNPFKNFSASSPEKLASKETVSLMLVGHALAVLRKKDFDDAIEQAKVHGYNPQVFMFLNENFQAHTPLLAMVARSTTASQGLIVSTLKKNGADAWNLRDQQSKVHGLLPDQEKRSLTLPFDASLLLMTGLGFGSMKTDQDVALAQKHLGRVFEACDAHPEVDWEYPVPATGESPLGLVARCLDVVNVSLVWGFLKDRGADPFRPGLNQLSPFEILEERVKASKGSGVSLLARESASSLLAQWREMRLTNSLDQAVEPVVSRRPRM